MQITFQVSGMAMEYPTDYLVKKQSRGLPGNKQPLFLLYFLTCILALRCTAKRGVQTAGMNFQTYSKPIIHDFHKSANKKQAPSAPYRNKQFIMSAMLLTVF